MEKLGLSGLDSVMEKLWPLERGAQHIYYVQLGREMGL